MFVFPKTYNSWDKDGERKFETGTKHGMLYVWNSVTNEYNQGVVWNGLSAVTESPSGADANDIYADDMKYLTLRSAETFGGTIEAYTYPEEFALCDGSANIVGTDGLTMTIGQQIRKKFAFAFTSIMGDDTEGIDKGMKLHVIYGATCSPSERAYQTVNDSPEAITFSWEFTTTPLPPEKCVIGGFQYKPISMITIPLVGDQNGNPTATEKKIIAGFYGSKGAEGEDDIAPTLLYPNEIAESLMNVKDGTVPKDFDHYPEGTTTGA